MIEVLHSWGNNPIDDQFVWHGLKAFQIKRIIESFQFISGWVILIDVLGEEWFSKRGKSLDRFINRVLWPVPWEDPSLIGYGVIEAMAQLWTYMQFATLRFFSRKGEIRAGYRIVKRYLLTKSYFKSNPQLLIPYFLGLYGYLIVVIPIGLATIVGAVFASILLLLLPVFVPALVLIMAIIVVLAINMLFFLTIKIPAWFLTHPKFRQIFITFFFLLFVMSSIFSVIFA